MKAGRLIFFLLLFPLAGEAQRMPEGQGNDYAFRFFDQKGRPVRGDKDNIRISLSPASGGDGSSLSVNYVDGYFRSKAPSGSVLRIDFISGGDTMQIETTASIDSIPFLRGNFVIPPEYAPLFSISTEGATRIMYGDWNDFRPDNLIMRKQNSLNIEKARFWKDLKNKIKLEDSPRIYGFAYDPAHSELMYSWDYYNLFVSKDKGLNWEQVHQFVYPVGIRTLTIASRETLYIAPHFGGRPDAKTIYRSVDGGKTWDVELMMTNLRFNYVTFKNGFEGIGIANTGPKPAESAVIYLTGDGGKNWIRSGTFETKLLPVSTVSWNKDNVVLALPDGYLQSADGGRNWTKISEAELYKRQFGYIYPALHSNGSMHSLEIREEVKHQIFGTLTFRMPRITLAASKTTWFVGSDKFSLITTDQGKNWTYFPQSSGASTFFIIDDQFIFDGVHRISFNGRL